MTRSGTRKGQAGKKQAETGKDRDIHKRTFTERDREEQTWTARDIPGQTGTARDSQ